MKHKSVPTLPQHVRAFCDGEFYRFLMNRAFLEECEQEINLLLEEGGDRSFNKIRVQGGEKAPEQQVILEKIEAIGRGRSALVMEKCCRRVQDVLDTLNETELLVVEQFYWRRIPPDITEAEYGIGKKTQQRTRRKIAFLLASRWGMV